MRIGEILRTPFPYRALLSISSDLDDTPGWREYFELVRFLNSDENTIFGRGLSLEFANSLFFNEPSSPVAYCNAAPPDRRMLRALIKTGHVDTLHSFGVNERTRSSVQATLTHLERHGCRLATWTDHWVSPTNFDPFKRTALGARQGSDAYCADLLANHGVSYVWAGRLTTVTGQGTPINLRRALAAGSHSLTGLRATVPEMAKLALGRLGVQKYSMRASNAQLQELDLSPHTRFLEFLRAHPSTLSLREGDSADGLPYALSSLVVRSLINSRGTMVLYTHLGRRMPRFGEPGHDRIYGALQQLRDLEAQGTLKTLSTTRLLDFLTLQQRLRPILASTSESIEICLDPDPKDRFCIAALTRSAGRGISVVVPRAISAKFRIMGSAPLAATVFSPIGTDYSIAYIPIGDLPHVPL